MDAAARAGKGVGAILGTLHDGEQFNNMTPEEVEKLNSMDKKDIRNELVVIGAMGGSKEYPRNPLEDEFTPLVAECTFTPKVGERYLFREGNYAIWSNCIYFTDTKGGKYVVITPDKNNESDFEKGFPHFQVSVFEEIKPYTGEVNLRIWSCYSSDGWYGLCLDTYGPNGGNYLYMGNDIGEYFDTQQEAEDKARKEGEKG